jgi:hypothetical protein
MKKLSKHEAARLSRPEAEKYASWLCEQAQAKIDAEAYAQGLATAAQIVARDEQAKLDAMIDARMGTITTRSGEVLPADLVPRTSENDGAIQRLGVRTGAR